MKDKKSVILYSPFYFPESISTARYNTYLVDALNERGADVTVYCSHPFYPEWRVTRWTDDAQRREKIVRGSPPISYPKSQVLRRFLLETWYLLFFLLRGRQRSADQNQVIVDIYPPNFFSVFRRFKSSRKIPIIGIVHDLQGLMSQAKASFFRRLVGALIRPIEAASLRRADKLVFLSEGMKNFAVSEYRLDASRCEVIYPFSTVEFDRAARLETPPEFNGNPKTLVYAGALGEKQAPQKLFELFERFAKKNPDYGVHIFSNGPIFDDLRERAASKLVRFHDLVPSERLPALLKYSRIQVIPQELRLSDGAFPSKLPNLLEARCRIFAVTDKDSELAEILSDYYLGEVSHDWDLSKNLDMLTDLACRSTSDSAAIEDEKILQKFRVENVVRVVDAMMQSDRDGHTELTGSKE